MIHYREQCQAHVTVDHRRKAKSKILLKIGPAAFWLTPKEAYELSNNLVDAAEVLHYAPR